jgi:hypothetical protein
MNAVFGCMLPCDTKSPVRASNLDTNWIGVSFFKQTTYQNSYRNGSVNSFVLFPCLG